MWRSRMFWKLLGSQAVLLLAAIGLLGAIVVRRVEDHYLRETQEGLRARALVIRELVRDRSVEQIPELQARLVELSEPAGMCITLLAGDGTVLVETEGDPAALENHADRPEIRSAREAGFATATRYSTTIGQPMMYGALQTERGQAVAVVRVAVPLTSVQAELTRLRVVVWTTAGATALGALALAFWLARRITLPLRELTQAADHIAAGGYGRTVYAIGRDEVGQLAQTFNHMSERLAIQFAQLRDDRQQLRTILGAMVEGVIALDGEQRILFVNDCAAELLEIQAHLAVGRRLWEAVRHRGLHEVVEKALGGPAPCEQELTRIGPSSRSLRVHAARLPDPAGRGAVLVLHDTTELRRLERLRQEFVANVSHELKTPLSVIKACIETLLDGAAEDVEHRGRFLDRISEQADRLHALILDLLSLARIESGVEVFELRAVPLAPLVASCLERHQNRAQGKSQVLRALPPSEGDRETGRQGDKENEGELAVWADEEAISQILDNLVDNAVKYTPEGGQITVGWRDEEGLVVLEVADTGIGIPEHDLPRIFERFYRVDKARSREMGGTGLGLSIVKHLVQAMSGTVSASSQVGWGTTFQIRLPRASIDDRPAITSESA
jgi:two-component system phosphate regulon sensor histidine kinase PhoR